MESKLEPSERRTDDPETTPAGRADHCVTGACGGAGLCPGVALLLAYLVGGGVAYVSGMSWLGWVAGVPTALILITGAWRWFPRV